MVCIICGKNIDMLDVGTEDEEYIVDCSHPICPDCFSLVLSNEYIKRVFKEWSETIQKDSKL